MSESEGRIWAETKGFLYFETSALSGKSVVEMFHVSSLTLSHTHTHSLSLLHIKLGGGEFIIDHFLPPCILKLAACVLLSNTIDKQSLCSCLRWGFIRHILAQVSLGWSRASEKQTHSLPCLLATDILQLLMCVGDGSIAATVHSYLADQHS